jgi:xanthine/CO dehydrogenase XdhC/CoxF family maturation factor
LERLGSKKTHANRCERLKEAGYSENQINSIFGPIGIKLGGKSAPEIALSIIAQLVSETYKKMITAILLAAGQSKRVPTKNKLLIKYRKKIFNQSYFRSTY